MLGSTDLLDLLTSTRLPSMFLHEKVSVSTTAAQVRSSAAPGEVFTLQADPANSGTIYLGRSNVTTDNGYPLAAGQVFTVDEGDFDVLYAVGSTGTQVLHLIKGAPVAQQLQDDSRLLAIRRHVLSVQSQIDIPVATAILAAGTPMAAFADNAGASAPGVTLANSEAVGIRWNNAETQTAIWYRVNLPQDLDDTQDIVLHALVSKSGATVGDATTLTFTAFFQTVGALHDADADAGGASDALTGDAAAKTVSELTRTIAAADVPAAPCALSLSVKPTDGTLGTDDLIMHALWIEYTKKLLAT